MEEPPSDPIQSTWEATALVGAASLQGAAGLERAVFNLTPARLFAVAKCFVEQIDNI